MILRMNVRGDYPPLSWCYLKLHSIHLCIDHIFFFFSPIYSMFPLKDPIDTSAFFLYFRHDTFQSH